MSAAALALGLLPGIGGSFVTSAVGYVTEATGHVTCYFKLLLSFYVASGFAIFLGNHLDAAADLKFSRPTARRFRIYVSAGALALLLLAAGRRLPRLAAPGAGLPEVLVACLIVAGLGFFCGALAVSGAVVVGALAQERDRTLVLTWLGSAAAGLLCIASKWATEFGPRAEPSQVESFFGSAALLATISVAFFAFQDWSGHVLHKCDDAKEGEPLTAAGAAAPSAWRPTVQCGNAFSSVFAIVLLPLLQCQELATNLVLWKLLTDCLGPLLMLCWRRPGVQAFWALVACRLFLLLFLLDGLVKRTAIDLGSLLVVLWCGFMLLGSVLNCCLDVALQDAAGAEAALPASPPASPPAAPSGAWEGPLRATRLAQQLGIALGLVAGGALLYGAEAVGVHPVSVSAACSRLPTCAPPAPRLAAARPWPCGRGDGGSGSDAGRAAGDAGANVRIFSYGANMGCAKLAAIGVYPVSEMPARALGFRVKFGSAEGFPTTAEEPAFAALAPCRGGGCAHGLLQELRPGDLARLAATEPGYRLGEIPNVFSYAGEELRGVQAFLPAGGLTPLAPSRRYAGLVWCQARSRLAAGYGEQLACELAGQGLGNLSCSEEKFLPLAAGSRAFLGRPGGA